MTTRQLRRAAERVQRKADRKAGFPTNTSTTTDPVDAEQLQQPDPALPEESTPTEDTVKAPISAAKLAANRVNARLSKGGLTMMTRAISAQNHTIHGLARHSNGTFKLLENEDPEAFAAAKQALLDEHLPTTETETILVLNMVESRWLSQRAQRLQDTCMSAVNGAVTDKDNFNLYLRYFNTHTRNFYKALQQLKSLRTDQRKAELGVEAQRLKQDAQTIQKEKLSRQKVVHEADVFIKEMIGLRERGKVTDGILNMRRAHPSFAAEMEAEFTKINAEKEANRNAAQAA